MPPIMESVVGRSIELSVNKIPINTSLRELLSISARASLPYFYNKCIFLQVDFGFPYQFHDEWEILTKGIQYSVFSSAFVTVFTPKIQNAQ